MRALVTSLLCVLLSSCASNAARIDALARSAELTRTTFDANGLRMLIYMRKGASSDRLVVFLEGDGIPWQRGIVPSEDPTTGHPLALQLAMQTPGAIAYVSRPCYQRVLSERCTPALWTSARYSEDVVTAMAQAVLHAQRQSNARALVLVGYSGGGTLAVLIAERLPEVAAVITIGANLDLEAWADHHRYLPLEDSLDPASSEREHPWRELHLLGGNDTVVPSTTTDRYFARYPQAERWMLAEHGHVCCWLREWPELWRRIEGLAQSQVTGDG